jgi:hypothetical protein
MSTAPIFNNGFDVSQATCTIAGIPCAESVRDYYEAADRAWSADGAGGSVRCPSFGPSAPEAELASLSPFVKRGPQS